MPCIGQSRCLQSGVKAQDRAAAKDICSRFRREPESGIGLSESELLQAAWPTIARNMTLQPRLDLTRHQKALLFNLIAHSSSFAAIISGSADTIKYTEEFWLECGPPADSEC